jgi:hypothetical protein
LGQYKIRLTLDKEKKEKRKKKKKAPSKPRTLAQLALRRSK